MVLRSVDWMKTFRVLVTFMLLFGFGSAKGQGSTLAPLTPSKSGRVVQVENPKATRAFVPEQAEVARMLNAGLEKLAGVGSGANPWQGLISPADIVGIKVVAAPGSQAGTRLAVVQAVVQALVKGGTRPNQIVIWDRRLVDLRAAGFLRLEEQLGVRVAGALDTGFDTNTFYETPLLGRLVFGDHEFGKRGEGVGRKSFLSKLVSQGMTRIITISPLLNHNLAGVSGALHSLALGSVDNILRFEIDPDRLATGIPEIWGLPEIGDKAVLHITDALIAQFAGEESTLLHYSTPLNQLWLSFDPVALDTLACRELERQRTNSNHPVARDASPIYANAELMDLGISKGQISIEKLFQD